jgi:hypothetical protein
VALARTDIGGYESAANIGTAAYVTPEFTPPANSLLVVFVGIQGNGTEGDLGTPTISGGGLTYTSRITAFGSSSWSMKLVVFTAPVGGSPSGMKLTIDDDNNQNIYGYSVSVVAFTGYDTTTPVAGAVGSSSTNTGDGEEKQTLGATPASADISLLAVLADASKGPPTPTLASGWTKIHDLKLGGEGGIATARRESSTSTEVKVTDVYGGGGSFFKGAMVSLIIKAGGGQSVSIGQAGETDSSQVIGKQKAKAVGQASEVNLAQVLTRERAKAVGRASETDSAHAITLTRSRTVAQAAETDTAQLIGRAKSLALGRASETDQARPTTAAKQRTLGRADETDTAGSIEPGIEFTAPGVKLPTSATIEPYEATAVVKVHEATASFAALKATVVVEEYSAEALVDPLEAMAEVGAYSASAGVEPYTATATVVD